MDDSPAAMLLAAVARLDQAQLDYNEATRRAVKADAIYRAAVDVLSGVEDARRSVVVRAGVAGKNEAERAVRLKDALHTDPDVQQARRQLAEATDDRDYWRAEASIADAGMKVARARVAALTAILQAAD
jgi:GrpB-like predicted nucleotidyltransferase (UPF0157 family)